MISPRAASRRFSFVLLTLGAVGLGTVITVGPALAKGPSRPTVAAVVAALRHAGLTVDHLQRQPIDHVPDAPPEPEKQAWGFTLRGVPHGVGRILIFATNRDLTTRARWFHSVGARYVTGRDVLVWLDRGVPIRVVRECQRAIAGVR